MIILEQENLISLRTAIVYNKEGTVIFLLTAPQTKFDPSSSKTQSTWLYRQKRSFFGELKLKLRRVPIEKNILPKKFNKSPKLELFWSDSGQSVALSLNQTPWAFIPEGKNHGYSKGILGPTIIGNTWDQVLFEKIFAA